MGRKMLRNRFNVLLAQKALNEGRAKIVQSEVAAATGLAEGTISRISTNKVSMYDNEVVVKLCEYFACEVGDLLYIHDPDSTSESHLAPV